MLEKLTESEPFTVGLNHIWLKGKHLCIPEQVSELLVCQVRVEGHDRNAVI